jgi:signal transduction histidine kinase
VDRVKQRRWDRADRLEEDRLAALGTLAAGMSHEILNPLNTISLACQYLEALLVRRGPPPEPVVREHFRLIYLELGRIRRILDDCTKFRKIPELSPEPIELGRFLRDTLEGFAWPAGPPQVRRDLAGLARADGVVVSVDRSSFRQAIGHVLENAVLGMPRGGTIRASASARAGLATIVVEDDGVGIPRPLLRKVFEPYFTTRPEALGIGLSLVRAIVRAHRGSITLQSRAGKGTRVAIRLPIERGRSTRERL